MALGFVPQPNLRRLLSRGRVTWPCMHLTISIVERRGDRVFQHVGLAAGTSGNVVCYGETPTCCIHEVVMVDERRDGAKTAPGYAEDFTVWATHQAMLLREHTWDA